MARDPQTSPAAHGIRRVLLLAVGALCVALAAVGVVLPLLPTTPFLLAAVVCFGRSSSRVHRWLMFNRVFGRYLRDYVTGKGAPWRVRIPILAILWTGILLSAFLAVDAFWVRVILFIIAGGVTLHIVTLRSATAQTGRTSTGRWPGLVREGFRYREFRARCSSEVTGSVEAEHLWE